MTLVRLNFDTPWKDILVTYFQAFMTMCHPEAAQAINWSKGYEALDKELTSITKESEQGTRIVDKLMKVWRANGEETWVLLHIEVQGKPEPNFAERMYIYHYRLFDRYRKPIVSLAVLADDQPSWRPPDYEHELWGCQLLFRFVKVKLLDYAAQQTELMTSNNPFAVVILAHISALKTKRNEQGRFVSKLALTRSLYDKGWDKAAILNLYTFIDWVMALSETFELQYIQEVERFEEEKQMRYITSAERIGIQKGIQQGIQQGEQAMLLRLLQRKFGSIPANYQQRIE